MAHRTRRWLLIFVASLGALSVAVVLTAQTAQPTAKDAAPILKEKCFQCHGESLKMSGLDLRTRESMLKGGDKGPAIVPGDASKSSLYRRVAGLDKPAMPMAPMSPLTSEQIAIVKDWIDHGASWNATESAPASQPVSGGYGKDYHEKNIGETERNWWAFRKPVRQQLPKVDARWNSNPIDAFVKDTLDKKGLAAAPEADRRTLIRRAYLDLLGLLPTPAEVDAFVKDSSPDAYKNLVEKLLASPHYGERWGRFWLDVVRYADSSGYEHDRDNANAWRYRDYVIKAFNQDKPYNRFVVEQLAGDELDNRDFDSLIATTYYRIGPRVRFREKDNPYYRYEYMDDLIRTTFQGFLGLSVNCARCHDHKFDPITRLDYYRSMAMFNGYVNYDYLLDKPDKVAEYERIKKEVDEESRPLYRQIARIEAPYKKAAYEKRLAKFPEEIQIAVKTPADKRTSGQALLAAQIVSLDVDPDAAANIGAEYRPSIKVNEADDAERKKLFAQIEEIQKKMPPMPPVAEGIRDGDYRLTPDGPGDEPLPGKGNRFDYGVKCCFLPQPGQAFAVPPVYFASNGQDVAEDQKSFVVQPGYLKVLATTGRAPADPPKNGYITSGRRRALAEWIAAPENPLAARVIVNRVWGWHFGRGIVATPGNFGKMGIPPSHPELLDWLATEFVRQGWSIKQIHRLIMNSETYKMSSSFYQAANIEKDPTDVYMWRFPLRRLEAEAIRDSILSASDKLNLQFGGEPFFPVIPQSVREGYRQGRWVMGKEGPDNWRRGVYSYWKRGLKYPMFDVYDEPDLNVTCERRTTTTVPTQALTLLNNEFVLMQAKFFAERVIKEAGDAPEAQIKQLYRIALSREPSQKEMDSYLSFMAKQRAYHEARKTEGGAELAALNDVAHVVLNSNEFVYIN